MLHSREDEKILMIILTAEFAGVPAGQEESLLLRSTFDQQRMRNHQVWLFNQNCKRAARHSSPKLIIEAGKKFKGVLVSHDSCCRHWTVSLRGFWGWASWKQTLKAMPWPYK